MKSFALSSCAGLVIALAAASANAQFFANGNLVITQIGDGVIAPSAAANQVTVREFSRLGAATGQQVIFGSATAGAQLTTSGTATSEGFLTGSFGSNRYLTVGGYDAAAGTAGVAATLNNAADGSGPTRRVVGRIDTLTGAVDYSNFGQTYSTGNLRSTQFDENNNNVLMAGTASAGNGGVRFGALGGGTSTTGQTSNLNNTRVVNIFNGQTIVSSASGAFQGLSLVSGGTATLLPGFPTATGPSSYDFVFADDRTVYVADDRANISGGLQRWTRAGGAAGDLLSGSWSLITTFNLSTATGGFAGLRGLAGETVGGVSTLFGISTDNRLVTLTDTGAGSAFITLANAPANTNWRGVEIVPAPGAAALMGLGLLVAARRRR